MSLGSWAKGILARKVDRQVEEDYPVWSKIKDALNGKKTAIGALIVLGPDIVDKVSQLIVALGGNPTAVAHVAGGVVVAIGLLHKAYKKLQEYEVLDDE